MKDAASFLRVASKGVGFSKIRIGLAGFLLVATCLMLLFVAIYERNRSEEIESKSVAISNPEFRKLIADDLKLMKREAGLQQAIAEFEKTKLRLPFDEDDLELSSRRELANLRNLKLKLVRERQKLESIRWELIRMPSS